MATQTAKWDVTVNRLAHNEVEALKREHPGAFQAFCQTMDMLANERYPSNPVNPDLDVCKLRRDAKGWCRAYINGHVQWRVIFRLLQEHNGHVSEVTFDFEIDDKADRRVIQITQLGLRYNIYQMAQARQDQVAGFL